MTASQSVAAVKSRPAHASPSGRIGHELEGMANVVRDGSERPSSSGSDMAKGMSQASRGLSIAFGFVGVVVVFWLGGRWLDDRLGWEPWLQITGALVGWVLGVVTVYYMVQQDQKKN